MEQLGSFLRKMREQKKLSIRQLAKFTGVSPAYISQLENNYRKNPTPHVLRSLCEGLEIDYEQFLIEFKQLSKTDIKERKALYAEYKEQSAVQETSQVDLYDLLQENEEIIYRGKTLSENERKKIKTMLHMLLE